MDADRRPDDAPAPVPGDRPPADQPAEPSRFRPSWQSLVIWIVVGGIALWLIISGVSGIIAKGG